MGLLDFDMTKVTSNPAFSLGMNILGNNTGHYGELGPALGGGLQDFQRQQSLQAQQARANAQAENQRAQLEMMQGRYAQQNAQFQQSQAQHQKAQELEQANKQWMQQNMPGIANAPALVQQSKIKARYNPQQHSYGTTPHQGADGKTYQLSSAGGLRQTPVNLVPPLNFVKYGSGIQPTNRHTGAPVGQPIKVELKPEQKLSYIEDKEVTTAKAKAKGGVMANIDDDISEGKRVTELLDKVIKHPYRTRASGWQSNLPTIKGSGVSGYEDRLSQLSGIAFLQAFNSLKGGGQITEIEGKKAEQAQNRLNSAVSDKDHLEALNEMDALIKERMQKLESLKKQEKSYKKANEEFDALWSK